MAKFSQFLIIVFTSLLFLGQDLNKPLVGHHDWNSVYFGQIAKNYWRFGDDAKLGQSTTTGTLSAESYYTHYPPLLPLAISVSYRLFGVSDWSTRLVPLIFTCISLGILYLLALELQFRPIPAAAAVLIMLAPIIRYFSHMADHEPLILFFSIGSVYFWLKRGRAGFLISVIGNGLTAWAGYLLYPLLWLKNRRFGWSLPVLGLIFCLHLLHTNWLTGSFTGGSLLAALKLRTDLPISLSQFLFQEFRWLAVYFTYPVVIIGLFALFFSRGFNLIRLFFVWGAAYFCLFPQVVFIHDYYNLLFVPWLSLSLAWLANLIYGWSRPFVLVAILVLGFWIYEERLNFFRALKATQAHEPGYRLGKLIDQSVPVNAAVIVVAEPEFISAFEVFINFYANRPVIYQNELKYNDRQYPVIEVKYESSEFSFRYYPGL